MSRQEFGEIAALEFHAPPEMDFPDIVEEFDISSRALATQVRRLTWDGEDIALIDRERVRIALGWLPPGRASQPHYLLIAMGPPPGKRQRGFDGTAYKVLLDRAVERVQSYLPFDAILRGPASQPVGSGLVDQSFDLLARTAPTLSEEARARARNRNASKASADWATGAMEPKDLPAVASVPMRLAIVTFGLTLSLQAPPIGVALLAYAALREAQPLLGS
jgi:hypothetical protein